MFIIPSTSDHGYKKKNMTVLIRLSKLSFEIVVSLTRELHNFKRQFFNYIDANKLNKN